MGQTPTFNDPFARRAAPGTNGYGSGQDRFREKAERAGAKKPAGFDKPKADRPKGDAFAKTAAPAKPVGDYYRSSAPKPAPAPAAKPAAEKPAQKPAPVAQEQKRAPLTVVASQPAIDVREAEQVEVHYQDLRREEARRTRMGRSSSLVLVTGSAAEAAADVIDAPPPAPAEKAPPVEPAPLVMPKAEPAPKKVRAGGGGGGSSGGGGPPAQGRAFNQDDFVGIAFGAAVLTLLLLWLMRGGGQAPQDNRLLDAQFASNEATVAPPPAPLADPFGDAPVDLKPTGPIPDPVEDLQAGVLEAVPAPAAPVVAPAAAPVPAAVADRTMRAWFCTAGSSLTTGSQAALEHEMKQFKDAFAGKELVVRGYADTRGTTIYNSALGGERANVVADFLRANGLTVVDSQGVGELDGLADNQNCANQRRVDVFVKGGPGETPSRTCAPAPHIKDLTCG